MKYLMMAFVALVAAAIIGYPLGYVVGKQDGIRLANNRERMDGYEEALTMVAKRVASGSLFKNYGPLVITNDVTLGDLLVIQIVQPPSGIYLDQGANAKLSAGTICFHSLKEK